MSSIGVHAVRLLGAVAIVGLAASGCSAVVTGRAVPAGGEAATAAAPDPGQERCRRPPRCRTRARCSRWTRRRSSPAPSPPPERAQLDHAITPLPGTGDEAYEEDGQVFLRKGTVWASVRLVRLNDPAENREPLRTAATLMVGRM